MKNIPKVIWSEDEENAEVNSTTENEITMDEKVKKEEVKLEFDFVSKKKKEDIIF